MFSLLRQRNFALLWTGGLVSKAGDLALITALPFYVYQQTGSTLASAGMVLASVVPSVVFGSFAGVFVDRWNRQRTMVIADSARAVLLLLLLLVGSSQWLWLVYVVTFAQSAIGLFFSPAENALLPQLVGEEHLSAANALNALNDNLARMIGPALGGALLGFVGLWSVVLLDVVSYAGSALLIGRIAILSTASPSRGTTGARVYALPAFAHGYGVPTVQRGLWRELVAALQLVRRTSMLAVVFLVGSIAAIAGGIQGVLLVAFVNDYVGGGAQTFGWALTAQGVGGVFGSWIIGRLGTNVPSSRLLGLSLTAVGLIFLFEVNLPLPPLFVLLVFLISTPVVGWGIAQQTLLQSHAPDEFRGRVFGAFATVTALLGILGTGFAGAFGQRLGVVPLLNGTAGLYLVSGIVAFLLLVRHDEKVAHTTNRPSPTSSL